MNDIVISGINLMLTGMITVFIFLATLILLINIVASLFENDITKGSINIDIPKTQIDINEHKKIIKLIPKDKVVSSSALKCMLPPVGACCSGMSADDCSTLVRQLLFSIC